MAGRTGKILIILVFILSAALYFRKEPGPLNRPPAARSIKDLTGPRGIRGRHSGAPQFSGAPLDSFHEDAETRCLAELDQEMKTQCPSVKCVYENLRKNGSWAALWAEDGWGSPGDTPHSNQRTALGQALYAVGEAGLLEGKFLSLDKEDAVRNLQNLSQNDPHNSFPLLFIAEIFRERGETGLAKAYLNKATSPGMHFESYLKDLVKELYLNNRQSRSDILGAMGVWGATPVPNYSAIKDLLDAYPQYVEAVSSQMAYDGLTGKVSTEMDWVPVEYALGRQMYNKYVRADAWPSFHAVVSRSRDLSGFEKDSRDCRVSLDEFLSYLKTL